MANFEADVPTWPSGEEQIWRQMARLAQETPLVLIDALVVTGGSWNFVSMLCTND
jgi:hypothetical protein